MKIKLICVGKTGKKFLEEGEQEYVKRLGYYLTFERIELPDVKQSKTLTEDQIKSREGEMIQAKIQPGEKVFLLDENGKEFNSEQFAEFLQKQFNQGGQAIVFVIGGPYGFTDALYKIAKGKISLSKMTFSHQMVRMFFVEQLYRSMTILRGEPYHHR
ncbi:MAG: 23S rRNA (pseudouridine(1915)-N(3))-methyltransferase RlmH [Crocinitomicaceae bacterium]|nr:23S rRNA (pseudouridine(1915)-N(3))-methyltransferase RlmH [Crocinitomicaceae bacterium]